MITIHLISILRLVYSRVILMALLVFAVLLDHRFVFAVLLEHRWFKMWRLGVAGQSDRTSLFLTVRKGKGKGKGTEKTQMLRVWRKALDENQNPALIYICVLRSVMLAGACAAHQGPINQWELLLESSLNLTLMIQDIICIISYCLACRCVCMFQLHLRYEPKVLELNIRGLKH